MPKRIFYGKYRAQVTNNQDPEKMGRVKVKIPRLLGEKESAWALPAFPPRMFGVPAVGDFVWVEFEGGNPDFPIYTLGFFPKTKVYDEAKQGYEKAEGAPGHYVLKLPNGLLVELSDVKDKNHVLVKTPKGHEVFIDEETQKIQAKTSGGHQLLLDDKSKKVEIKTTEGNTVVLDDQAKKVFIESKGTAEIKTDGDLTATIGGKANVSVNGDLTASVSGSANISVDGTCNITASGPCNVDGSAVNLGGGGPPVARIGDAIVGSCPHGPVSGTIVGGSGKVMSA